MSVLVNPIAPKIPYPTTSRHPDLTLTRLLIVVAAQTWQYVPSILLREGRVYCRSTLRSSERGAKIQLTQIRVGSLRVVRCTWPSVTPSGCS